MCQHGEDGSGCESCELRNHRFDLRLIPEEMIRTLGSWAPRVSQSKSIAHNPMHSTSMGHMRCVVLSALVDEFQVASSPATCPIWDEVCSQVGNQEVSGSPRGVRRVSL